MTNYKLGTMFIYTYFRGKKKRLHITHDLIVHFTISWDTFSDFFFFSQVQLKHTEGPQTVMKQLYQTKTSQHQMGEEERSLPSQEAETGNYTGQTDAEQGMLLSFGHFSFCHLKKVKSHKRYS